MATRQDNPNPLAGFFDGERGEEDFAAIDRWLREDPRRVTLFVDYLLICEDLRRLSQHDDLRAYEDDRPTICLAPREGTSAGKGWRTRSLAALAIAGSLLLGFFLTKVPFDAAARREADANRDALEPVVHAAIPPRLVATPRVVATLSDGEGCHWGEVASGISLGELLPQDSQLDLLAGVAQLTFETGVHLVVEAPTKLTLGANRIELSQGSVSAVVPRAGVGFTIVTPTSEVIDLGTEFGVQVDESGESQVHVFSGEVATRPRNSDGQSTGEFTYVRTNTAIRYGPNSKHAERLAANEAAFQRMTSEQLALEASDAPPVEGDLLLWFSADHCILDEQDRVMVWRDRTSSRNPVPDHALQADRGSRPFFVKDSIGGRPALRFDGRRCHLVTTPVHSSDSQTIAFVAAVDDADSEMRQVINYNGPPQFETMELEGPNILQISTNDGLGDHITLSPFVFMGQRGDESIKVGQPEDGAPPEGSPAMPKIGEPFVAVYVYDHTGNRAGLWINGKLFGVSTAPATIEVNSRKVIGRHGGWRSHFHGDIAELIVFDEGLDDDRIHELNNKLMEKYGLK